MRKEMYLLIVLIGLLLLVGVVISYMSTSADTPIYDRSDSQAPKRDTSGGVADSPNTPEIDEELLKLKSVEPFLDQGYVFTKNVGYQLPDTTRLVQIAIEKGYYIKEFASDATCDGNPIDFSLGCPSGMIEPPKYDFKNMEDFSPSAMELEWKKSTKHIVINKENIILYYKDNEFYFTFTCPELNKEDCLLKITVKKGISQEYVKKFVEQELRNIGLLASEITIEWTFN